MNKGFSLFKRKSLAWWRCPAVVLFDPKRSFVTLLCSFNPEPKAPVRRRAILRFIGSRLKGSDSDPHRTLQPWASLVTLLLLWILHTSVDKSGFKINFWRHFISAVCLFHPDAFQKEGKFELRRWKQRFVRSPHKTSPNPPTPVRWLCRYKQWVEGHLPTNHHSQDCQSISLVNTEPQPTPADDHTQDKTSTSSLGWHNVKMLLNLAFTD